MEKSDPMGNYPQNMLVEKIYRNRISLQFCKEHGIHLYGPKLGSPTAQGTEQKKQNYIDEGNRIEVERRYSLAKRKCGLWLIVTKLKDNDQPQHCHVDRGAQPAKTRSRFITLSILLSANVSCPCFIGFVQEAFGCTRVRL